MLPSLASLLKCLIPPASSGRRLDEPRSSRSRRHWQHLPGAHGSRQVPWPRPRLQACLWRAINTFVLGCLGRRQLAKGVKSDDDVEMLDFSMAAG